MDIDIKRAILYTAGMEGFLNQQANFLGMNVNRERKELLEKIRVFAEKVSKNSTQQQADKLVAEIKTGQISVEVVENFEKIENKKRMSKMKVKVNRGMLDTIAEEAMASCENCERNMKKCLLRRALLDCNIEKYHDSDKICQYKQI